MSEHEPDDDQGPEMSNVQEIPQMVAELVDMSKNYVRQEVGDSAKLAGRVAGMALLAGILFSIGGVLLAIAGMRVAVRAIGAGPIASSLGYIASTVVLLIIVAFLGRMVGKRAS